MPQHALQVVYVNYRATSHLARSLQSVWAQAGDLGHLEVTVVDNSVDEAETASLRARVDGRAEVIVSPENVGFARGCNAGVAASLRRGEHLLFLNPDTIVPAGTLGRMVRALAARPRALVGPRHYADEGQLFAHAPLRGARLFDEAWDLWFAYGWDPRRPDRYLRTRGRLARARRPVRVRALSGGCLAMTRRAFDRLGGWDEGYWLYGEDVDLSVRGRRRGLEVLLLPDVPVVHEMEVSARQVPDRVAESRSAGRERFKRVSYSAAARRLERAAHAFLQRRLPRRGDPWSAVTPLRGTELRAPATDHRWAVEIARSPLFDNCLTAFPTTESIALPERLIRWLPPGTYFVRVAREHAPGRWRTTSLHTLQSPHRLAESPGPPEGGEDEGPVPVRLDQHVS